MADTMTQAEIAAYDRFREEQAAAAAQENERDRSLEAHYLDAFERATETDGGMHIMEAVATIAAFFHDDDPAFMTETSDPNALQYQQKGVLGSLCQQARWMLEREQKRTYALRKRAQIARREHAGGEIDTLELEEAEMAYVRNVKVQVPVLEDFLTAAKAAYLAQFAEEWQPFVKRDNPQDAATLDRKLEAAPRKSRL